MRLAPPLHRFTAQHAAAGLDQRSTPRGLRVTFAGLSCGSPVEISGGLGRSSTVNGAQPASQNHRPAASLLTTALDRPALLLGGWGDKRDVDLCKAWASGSKKELMGPL